jgi:hypothetical protein
MIPRRPEKLEPPEQPDEDLTAAEAALEAAQRIPPGPERISALRRAGQMRFDAYRRRFPTEKEE